MQIYTYIYLPFPYLPPSLFSSSLSLPLCACSLIVLFLLIVVSTCDIPGSWFGEGEITNLITKSLPVN